MTTRTQQTTSRRWVILFLAVLVAALATIVSSVTASAATNVVAETHVGAHEIALDTFVGPLEHICAGQRLGNDVAGQETAVATGVAAKSAPGIKVGSKGGESAGKVFPQSVRKAALDENPSTCVYCRMKTDRPQVDHAIPRSRGGNATLDNAQTTCGWCNASKGARDFPVNPPPGFEGMWPPGWWLP